MAVERALTDGITRAEAALVYERFCAEEALVYRPDIWPYGGRTTIRTGLEIQPGAVTWQPIEVRASRSQFVTRIEDR